MDANRATAVILGHPIRTTVVGLLAEHGRLSATGARLKMRDPKPPLALVAYHFRMLENAGVIRMSGQPVQRRGAIEKYWRLTPGALAAIDQVRVRLDDVRAMLTPPSRA